VRKLSATVAASLLAVAALAAPVIGAMWHDSGGQDGQDGQAAVAAADPGDVAEADESSTDDDQDADTAAERGGPPPWAHSAAQGKKAKHGLDAWKRLTPAQKEALMTRLTREHAAGMKAYSACRADGRKDCKKPLPPGLAKRL
jgi:hypothetical protein